MKNLKTIIIIVGIAVLTQSCSDVIQWDKEDSCIEAVLEKYETNVELVETRYAADMVDATDEEKKILLESRLHKLRVLLEEKNININKCQ